MKAILFFLVLFLPLVSLAQDSSYEDEQKLRAEHSDLLIKRDRLQSELTRVNFRIDSILARISEIENTSNQEVRVQAIETTILWDDNSYTKRRITALSIGAELLRISEPTVNGYQKVIYQGREGWIKENVLIPVMKVDPPPIFVNPPAVRATSKSNSTTRGRSCCKVCTKGKPCGNSCISRSYTCRKPPGCAC